MLLDFSDSVTNLFVFGFTPKHLAYNYKCLIKIDDQIRHVCHTLVYHGVIFFNKYYLSILAWPRFT